ncbi:MAG: TAXI family TRAP transporter solute-binding subunit [Dehalococcoidia bacterium]
MNGIRRRVPSSMTGRRPICAVAALALLIAACGGDPDPAAVPEDDAAPDDDGDSAPTDDSEEAVGSDLSGMQLTLGTSASGGTFFIWGAAAANAINQNSELHVTSQATAGSSENPGLIERGDIDLALMDSCGAENFADGLDGIYAGASLPFTVVVPADSDAESFRDLVGESIAVPSEGVGGHDRLVEILTALDIEFEDFSNVQKLSPAEEVAAYKNGEVDVVMMTSGNPQPHYLDLPSHPRGMKLVPFSDEEVEAIVSSYPCWSAFEIPAGTYDGIDTPVQTPATWFGMVSGKDLPEEVAYEIAKSLDAGEETLRDTFGGAAESTAQNTADYWQTIPLHPGVESYLNDEGYLG